MTELSVGFFSVLVKGELKKKLYESDVLYFCMHVKIIIYSFLFTYINIIY